MSPESCEFAVYILESLFVNFGSERTNFRDG
jgi:hypothetical protein